MSDEIKATAEFVIANHFCRWGHGTECKCPGCAARDLASAVLKDLALRERDLAERELGVQESWLLSIGFERRNRGSYEELCISGKFHEVYLDMGRVGVLNKLSKQVCVVGVALTTTRGMMLDFLSSLKIPTKAVTHVASD